MPRSSPRTSPARTSTVARAFLFSDLRGYTDFVQAHGDAAAADLLRAYPRHRPRRGAPIARTREYAERARATWYLSELDGIEATITDAH